MVPIEGTYLAPIEGAYLAPIEGAQMAPYDGTRMVSNEGTVLAFLSGRHTYIIYRHIPTFTDIFYNFAKKVYFQSIQKPKELFVHYFGLSIYITRIFL